MSTQHVTNAEMRSPKNLVLHGLYLGLFSFVKYLALPFAEYLRYAVVRCFSRTIRSSAIADGVTLLFPWRIDVGPGTSINQGCIIDGFGGVTIGNDVRIASYVRLNTSDHGFERRDLPIRSQGFDVAPIVIGNDVWLGTGVVVGKGVTIGDGCVVGAGSVVTRDLPPFTVAVGVPARVLRDRGAAEGGDDQ